MRNIGLLTIAVLTIALVSRWVIAGTQTSDDARVVPIDPFLMMTQAGDLVAQQGIDYFFGP